MYILNRDVVVWFIILFFLEVYKVNILVYYVVGVDVGFENLMFVCLEMDYEEVDNDLIGEVVVNI